MLFSLKAKDAPLKISDSVDSIFGSIMYMLNCVTKVCLNAQEAKLMLCVSCELNGDLQYPRKFTVASGSMPLRYDLK